MEEEMYRVSWEHQRINEYNVYFIFEEYSPLLVISQ